MSSCVEESALFSLSTKDLVTAHQGTCTVVYQAVCAEAIRIIFALYELSQSGAEKLGDELRHCRTDISECWHSPLDIVDRLTPQSQIRSSPLLSCSPSHEDARLRPQSQSKEEFRALFSSTDVRGRITNASLYGLLTAAHLLRCSTWTAVSLVPRAWREGHSAGTQVLQLLSQARAAEELRTRESGWCATALVQLTEWMLFSGSPHAPSSVASTLLSRALSVAELQRTPTDRRDHFLCCPPPLRTAGEAPSDPLPLYFPLLLDGKERSRTSVSSPWQPSRVSDAVEGGCIHDWLLDDLPQWCAQVSLEAQSKAWYRISLLRRALERWRARRGLRVVAHLSHAAASAPEVEPHQSALTAHCFSLVPQVSMLSSAGSRKVVEEAPPQRLKLSDASEAVTLSHTTVTQTAAHTPRISKVDSRGSGVPPAWSFTEVREFDVSTIEVDTAPPSPSQSQYPQCASLPAAPMLPCADHGDDAASVSKTHRLESVLRGVTTMRSPPSLDMGAEDNISTLSEECGQSPHRRPREIPLLQRRGDVEDSLASSTPAMTLSSKQRFLADANCTSPSSGPTALSAHDFFGREAQQEERARFIVQRRENAVLHQLFFHWRDRRLYESLATRFIQLQRRETTRAQCWACWRRRRAALLQRHKEVRDMARCDAYTELKALQYFKRLLQRWKMAVLVRRFRISTLGHRILRAWGCTTRFVQAQRALQQKLIGAGRVKWQVWTQWQERRQESVADRHRAEKHRIAVLLLMKEACVRQRALRVATSQCNAVILRRALQRWTLRCTISAQLRTFIASKRPHSSLTRQAWWFWRSRCLERQQRRDQEHRLRAFRVAQFARVCFTRWVQRWRRDTHIRACVARQQRRHLLHSLFLQWHRRMQVCMIVRQGQQELALKIGEQLQGRRVLRTWRRRATQHAADSQRLREAIMDTNAERLLRLSRLARTFYHWRTYSFVLQRYNVDRRRCLPVTANSTAGMRSIRGRGAVLRITGDSRVEHHEEADVGEVDSESTTNPAAMVPLPLPARSAVSKVVPPGRSHLGRPEYASRAPTHYAAFAQSSQRSPAHCGSTTAMRRSTAAAAAAHDGPESTGHSGKNEGGRTTTFTAPQGGFRAVLRRQLSIPLRKRTIALQRQLLAVQLQQRLFFSSASCVQALATSSRSMPPAQPVFAELPYSITPTPGRTTRVRTPPPTRAIDQHWHSNESGSDTESQAPLRSCTATPLFSARKGERAERLRRKAARRHSAALVESPHSSSPLQPHSGTHLRDNNNYATVRSSSVSATPTQHLLSQMEQLARRIRTLEAGYTTEAATAVWRAGVEVAPRTHSHTSGATTWTTTPPRERAS
ncbi:hypothetical protein MNV84_02999 [Leishmania braziliensis]|nr:hypothetical protein MNV84_02999 [Leishmania braziliensis]